MLRSIVAIGLLLIGVSNAWALGEETIGNEALRDSGYRDWPNVMPVINDTHRVYHSWVNGNEQFYFDGDTDALNATLRHFAKIKAEKLTVVLRPGPAATSSFRGDHSFEFTWRLHLLGGIAKHMATRDLGSNVWDPHPYLYVYVGKTIKLDAVKIPAGVKVMEIADLQTQYAKSLASSDQTVRGWSCGEIARLDPYNVDSMRKIAARMDDEVDWVKLNAAGALSNFQANAEEVIRKLEAVKTEDQNLRDRITKTIDELRNAESRETARREHQAALTSIHAFVLRQRKSS